MGKEVQQAEAMRTAFIRILIEDVIGALALHEMDGSQSHRRHLIRALFTAIEGMVWTYREHVVGVAKSCDTLTFEEELAFSEVSYSVTSQGKIVELARFVPLLAMFRLTTKLAERLDQNLIVRFDDTGWEALRRTVEIRNRITHPKSEADLEISEPDLSTCRVGFDWLFELSLMAMESTNVAYRKFTEELGSILESLKRSDPDTIAAYDAAAKSIQDL